MHHMTPTEKQMKQRKTKKKRNSLTGTRHGIISIQAVQVVQTKGYAMCIYRAHGPFKDLFAPILSHVIMKNAFSDQLLLSSVPERIVSICYFKLFFIIHASTHIAAVIKPKVILMIYGQEGMLIIKVNLQSKIRCFC